MKAIALAAQRREQKGKGPARRCRADGRIPGVLYGVDIDPTPLSIPTREFMNAARGEDTVWLMVNLKFDGESSETMALIRDVQRDPINGKIKHIDFLHVSPTRKLSLRVPVVLKGTPEGVKLGGVLQHIMRDLEVECLPKDIPEKFEIDVSELNIGDAVHVSDLKMENVEILAEERRAVVTVVPPTVIKEPTTTADAEAEAAGEPELVGEEAEGEGEEKAEGDKKEE